MHLLHSAKPIQKGKIIFRQHENVYKTLVQIFIIALSSNHVVFAQATLPLKLIS